MDLEGFAPANEEIARRLDLRLLGRRRLLGARFSTAEHHFQFLAARLSDSGERQHSRAARERSRLQSTDFGGVHPRLLREVALGKASSQPQCLDGFADCRDFGLGLHTCSKLWVSPAAIDQLV
jgi:hypothetical protein